MSEIKDQNIDISNLAKKIEFASLSHKNPAMNFSSSNLDRSNKIVLISAQSNTCYEIIFSDSPIILIEIKSQSLCFKLLSNKYMIQVHKDSSEVYICKDRFELFNNLSFTTAAGTYKYKLEDAGVVKIIREEVKHPNYLNLCKVWNVKRKYTNHERKITQWEVVSLDDNLLRIEIRTNQVDSQGYCLPLELNENMIISVLDEEFHIKLYRSF